MLFTSPIYLILLATFLPLAAWAAVRVERRRRIELQTFGDEVLLARSSPLPRRGARLARFGVLGCAFAAGLVALARPQFGARPAALSGSGRDVLLLLDLSGSMQAQDIAPSRLGAAKEAARAIVAALPGDRIGLAVFGGSAFLDLPPTLDRSGLGLYLDAVSPTDIPDPGTNLERALAVADAVLAQEDTAGSRAIVLLSDGESLEGNLDNALAELKRHGRSVFAVGIGTPAGAVIPDRGDDRPVRYHRDQMGRIVVTRLDEAELRRIARETGGAYARWEGAPSLRPLVAALSAIDERRPVASRMSGALAERFQWPLALVVLGLIIEALLPERLKGKRR